MMSTLPRRVAGLLIAGTVLVALAGCTGATPSSAVPSATAPAASSASSGSTDCPTSQPPALGAGETRTVTMETEKGTIVIKLEGDLSPIAAGNVAALAGCGYYDGVVFHRVVPGFVIQGGDPTGSGTGGPGYTIKDEPVTTEYKRGTVAMARTSERRLRRVAVLHRPRRCGRHVACRSKHQQLPDHRVGHVGHGGGRRHRECRRRRSSRPTRSP